MSNSWPTADLDPARRLQIMAAAIPGAMAGEVLVHRPIDEVWARASDLETELPLLVHDFREVRVSDRVGDRLVARARSPLGLRACFDVVLQPHWCWCESRFLLCGMAAAPQGDDTVFAFLGGLRLPGAAGLERVASRPAAALLQGTLERFAARAEAT
ncbi:hypothetical protein [Flexivirga sp. B27]